MIRYIFSQIVFTGFNLLCDRQGMAFGKITGTSATAENAAAGSKCSIPVWTGHTAIERNLIELFTISSFQIIIERIISFSPQRTVISDQFLYSTTYNVGNTWIKSFRKNIIFI